MQTTVFISRELAPDSEFVRLLPAPAWGLRGFSLLALEPLPIGELPAADWVFFYSQQAAQFFFRFLKDENRALPSVRWAAIGPATARAVLAGAGKIDFTGAGDPDRTASDFAKVAAGQRVLFPCARNSRHSIQRKLGAAIVGQSLEIYDNAPRPDLVAPLDDDFLVFTSPLNAQAYFSKFEQRAGQKIVAIGQTTASALRELGLGPIFIAPDTSETGLAQAVLAAVNRP